MYPRIVVNIKFTKRLCVLSVSSSLRAMETATPKVGLFFLPSFSAVGLELVGLLYFGGDCRGLGKGR